ncbi:Thimet oligopeptidase [Grifola frondosa]|uniref:Thimet oligopeptidase n=1 Tax=Grifola frondosa TaxID=5627 RepID=A0A1C7M2H7_GRIFR|nr:Thimet oligopeptidase [Grifola frondosa]
MAMTTRVAAASLAHRRCMLGLAVGVGALAAIRLPQNLGTLRVVTPTSLFHRSLSGLFSPSTNSRMASLNPPQASPTWTHSAADVLALTKDAIQQERVLHDKVAALAPADCNFESVFVALAHGEATFDSISEPLSFYQNVSPSKELRDASNEAEILVRDFGVESSMRLDVFRAKQAAEKNIKESGRKLSPEEQRLVDKMLLDGRRAGLALPEKERDELTRLKKELSQTSLEFSGTVSFTLEELKGVPADVISGYSKRTEGNKELYDITFKTPDIFPVFKFAENPETRRIAYERFESRLEINVPILSKALDLRRQIAKLLEYDTWADFVTEVKMVKNAKGVKEFLTDLEQKLRPVGLKDRETLLALKKEEHEEKGLPFDGEFYIWDYRYYDRKFIERTLNLDDQLVKEYFPVSVVVPAILEIYQNLLGVRFVEIKGETWHPEVQQFAVWENDAKDSSGFVGYCYLDLFPRASKYSHAAVWPLLPGYAKPDSTRSYPLTAMVANLAKPTPQKPALMRHDDVVTFFHEMGHVFHGLLSRTKFSRFHGTSVAGDFVEAPSQMLENWCFEPKALALMSSHYETKKPLSPELIEKIIKSRYVNVGLFYLRQLFFANFDIKVHTDKESADYTQLWNDMRESISLVKGGKLGAGQGSFNHIASGYDAGYYGYTYSLVFAADMYATVFKQDPLDPARGQLYREKILLPGGSRDEIDSLKDFLGRPPNSEAFIKELFVCLSGMYKHEDLSHLRDLGIPEKIAKYALEHKGGNVEEAAEFALSGEAGKAEVSQQTLVSFIPTARTPFSTAMTDRAKEHRPEAPRKRSWIGKYGASSKDKETGLASPVEGQELSYDRPYASTLALVATSSSVGSSSASSGLPFRRTNSTQSVGSSTPARPATPLSSKQRSNSSTSLTKEGSASQNALERTTSQEPGKHLENARNSGSFTKMSLSSMMGGFPSLSLSRGGSDDKERGRSEKKDKDPRGIRSSSFSGMLDERDPSGSRTRSQSPFRLRRSRARDPSPAVEALSQSDVESDAEGPQIRPRNAFSLSSQWDEESGDDTEEEESEEEWSGEGEHFDDVTSRNTERNALTPANAVEQDIADVPDYLGEGVNVVVPPEPYFPSTLNYTGTRNVRRRKSTRPHDTLPLETSRPVFQRDRCTITITHGYPARVLEETGRRGKRYVLASDLSVESRYALEWGIGTVLRDGDEMLIVTVVENEAKVDPAIPNTADRATKLRSQQERQAMAYILVRQATGLLQRTHLNVTISCQAWHAKNSRHMLLDVVDYVEPTMLIVGSPHLHSSFSILLGSTSHYLIQKCSVPVMVARRRLKRPPRRSAHLATHRARVSLAQAGIDRVASKVDQDVAVMRDEISRDDERRNQDPQDVEEDPETEAEGDVPTSLGTKVAGTE